MNKDKFKRENRYIVLKRSDLDRCVHGSDADILNRIIYMVDKSRQSVGKNPLTCVVVESDWPEYEPVWKMIQDRVEGNTRPSVDIEELAREVDLPLWHECDERFSQLNSNTRTIAQSVLNGSELTPLENVIHSYDDADPDRSAEFCKDIKSLVEWCLNNPNQVLAQHESLAMASKLTGKG